MAHKGTMDEMNAQSGQVAVPGHALTSGQRLQYSMPKLTVDKSQYLE